ncbi:hypothetical protein BDN72DRAFT_778241 [Pluteus cervinus]|uniref:Uncharacterized protein n=1 Tax=Pluteus cervinus TaxID=181527 RepID=A0ACD3A730_9AGAR|nr:hypothetical protein BDN72DRAFT_778241 [Pluteus cervinus]
MTVAQDGTPEVTPAEFLNTLDGEISFFRSIMRARPVGLHRHFHVLVIQNSIFKDTGRLVRIEDIWEKLKTCYDLEALDAIDLEAEGYEPNGVNGSPTSIPSPSPSENLSGHPFFREEFSLPYEEFEPLVSARRMRDSVSAPSSPAQSPVATHRGRTRPKRGKSKIDMAGLVGGDSDSSALTQESGDEGAVGTPITGTDGGTEDAGDEDVEMRDPSPGKESLAPYTHFRFIWLLESSRPTRNRTRKRGNTRGRGASTNRGRKRKRDR